MEGTSLDNIRRPLSASKMKHVPKKDTSCASRTGKTARENYQEWKTSLINQPAAGLKERKLIDGVNYSVFFRKQKKKNRPSV